MKLAQPSNGADTREEGFYAQILRVLKNPRIPFRVGGTCAVNIYAHLKRQTKDLDIFCRHGDYPRLLAACAAAGFVTEVEDERWIAKIRHGDWFCDVIFGSANATAPVSDQWLRERVPHTVLGVRVFLLPVTELIFSKSFIQDRMKFDGNDIAHLILQRHGTIDWRRLLGYMEAHWEVLLAHLIRFRYIYPTERTQVPNWLLDELLSRLATQRAMPLPRTRVCRGRVFSRSDFLIDITDWGLADLVGEEGEVLRSAGGRSAHVPRLQCDDGGKIE